MSLRDNIAQDPILAEENYYTQHPEASPEEILQSARNQAKMHHKNNSSEAEGKGSEEIREILDKTYASSKAWRVLLEKKAGQTKTFDSFVDGSI